MNCQFSRAEKILAATLGSEATQRSILFAQPSFCQPLSDFCFCIFFNKFHHHGVLLSSGVSVAKKTLDLWTPSRAFIDPQARAISTPNVNIIPSLFHNLIVCNTSSSTLQSLEEGEITKIQMTKTVISQAKNKTMDSTLGQSKNFNQTTHIIWFSSYWICSEMQIWDGHMKWSHTVERIKITASDANMLPFRSTFCNTMKSSAEPL